MSQNYVTNTKQQMQDDPNAARSFLFLGIAAGGSAAIEHQEKQGQQELCRSKVLPSDMRSATPEMLQQMGIEIGDPVKDDPLFVHVTLPDGWRIVETKHSMWTELRDNKDRKRASIFYKAAFYDRSAFLSLVSRYEPRYEPVGGWDAMPITEYIGFVTDGGDTRIFETSPYAAPESGEKSFVASDRAGQEALDWLSSNFPDWKDPLAYWD